MSDLTTSVTKSNQHPGFTTITPRGQYYAPNTSDQWDKQVYGRVCFESFYIRYLRSSPSKSRQLKN